MSLIITRGLGPETELTSTPVVIGVNCVTSRLVRVTFLEAIKLEEPAGSPSAWSIVALSEGESVSVLGVSYQANAINIITTEHKESGRYVLVIPKIGIVDADVGGPFSGPFQYQYDGMAEPPFIVTVKGVDQTAIDVVFSEEVVAQEALNPENYTVIGPGDVTVLSVQKLDELSYRLKTTRQVRLAGYAVAVENIHDLSGNAIVSDHT